MTKSERTATTVAVTVLGVAGIAGIVALTAVGGQGQANVLLPLLIGFLAPTITSLINGSKLDKLDGRLNGEMDARIRRAVEQVLEEHGVLPQREEE